MHFILSRQELGVRSQQRACADDIGMEFGTMLGSVLLASEF
jgi:hypothetical protein